MAGWPHRRPRQLDGGAGEREELTAGASNPC